MSWPRSKLDDLVICRVKLDITRVIVVVLSRQISRYFPETDLLYISNH